MNFPLILTCAVFVSGAIWLFDRIVWRPSRLEVQSAWQKRNAGLPLDLAANPELAPPLLVEYAGSFFPVLFVVLFLRSFLVEPYQIPSGSMRPTLEVGDFILVNKYIYGVRLPVVGTKIIDMGEPARGDVMVFVPKHRDEYFIKRVIGLPGDKIAYKNKVLYINNERLSYEFSRAIEGYNAASGRRETIREYTEQIGGVAHPIWRYERPEQAQEWQVPDGHYFMMGDNRGNSRDSRAWARGDANNAPDPGLAFVPEANIVGRAFAIWMHMPGWSVPSFERNQKIR